MQRLTVSDLFHCSPFNILIPLANDYVVSIDSLYAYTYSQQNKLMTIHPLIGQKFSQIKINLSGNIDIARLGDLLGIISSQCQFYVFNLQTQILQTFLVHVMPITCVHAFGGSLVTGSRDMTVRLWQADSQGKSVKIKTALVGHQNIISCLNSYGNLLISGSSDRNLKFWYGASLWASKQLTAGIINICACPSSEQVAIFTGKSISFIKIKPVMRHKKVQIYSTIQIQQSPYSGCEIDESFLVYSSKGKISFVEVNLYEQLISKQLEASIIKSCGRTLFMGIPGKGIAMIKL